LKIAVCLKRVPDTTTKIVVGGDGTSIDETGVKFVPNPYDEYALEAALSLKEKAGAGETVVVTLGGDAAQETAAEGGCFVTRPLFAGAIVGSRVLLDFARVAGFDLSQAAGQLPVVHDMPGHSHAHRLPALNQAE